MVSKMTLYQRTANLRADRNHLESALESLRQNQPIEKSNSLATVLTSQFAKIESDVERERSISAIDRIMTQLLVDLESHERALAAAGSRVNHGIEQLKAHERKYRFAVVEAENLLKEIASLSQNLETDRVETGRDRPLAKIVGTFAASVVEVG